MEYTFRKIDIAAPFPTTQCGHSCQTYELDTYHDPLYARLFSFHAEDLWLFHYSLDLLAFDAASKDLLEKRLQEYYADDSIRVITSATHTHYANSVRDDRYKEYLLDLLYKESIGLQYEEKEDLYTTCTRIHSTAIGKSRISGYETGNEILSLIRFFSAGDNFLNIVYYNCHPTILSANTQYFSAEYPGYVLSKLEKAYPHSNFTFLQGAAGDISSRFVRDGQDYDALMKLGDALYKQIDTLMKDELGKKRLQLKYNSITMDYEHEFTPIDLGRIRSDLSERELETIRIGQEERAKLEKKSNQLFGKLIDKADIVSLELGSVKLIFFPNEIFSQYIDYINKDHELLVSYSNGYGPYVLPLNFEYITYEMFTDTLTTGTKVKLIEALKTV